jgi:NAD(P)-dependent dehydrogenase (short-subunit alcohol dehydrogenase family)
MEKTMQSLTGKVAFITGAAQGIGAAIAERFASQGAAVLLMDLKGDEVQAVADRIAAAGGAAHAAQGDVGEAAAVDAAIAAGVDRFGGIDILVNNAALAIYRSFTDYTPEEWDRVLGVNLRGIFLTSRRCLPLMAQRGGGSIVQIASIHARTTAAGNAPYVASKGAVVALTRAMALEAAPLGVRVNCILPGAINTAMTMENWGNIPPEQHPLMPRIPLARFGQPDDIARVALFLASDDSAYMTGSDVLVDGGLSAHFN